MILTYYNYDKENIAIDIETKDPFLKEKGNGVFRKDGYILGVSFSNGRLAEYYPINHQDTEPEQKEKNLKYITEQLQNYNSKIFANGLYDLDWFINFENLTVNGSFEDVQIAEPLLDEYKKSYSLNNLSQTYLGKIKFDTELKEYSKKMEWKDTTKNLWRMPAYIVEKYAALDAQLTFQIFQKQKPLLKKEGLEDIYKLEMDLYPLLLQMRREGVYLDKDKLLKAGLELSDIAYDLQQELNTLAGFDINVNSGKQLASLFSKLGLPIVYGEPTDLMMQKGIMRGNPKFDKATLSNLNNNFAKKILEARHITTLLNMFIIPYPELLCDEKIHCNFNPLRSDNYGTVSGRFSSSNPNLQQVSGKNEDEYIHSDSEILNGLVVRKLFVPKENCDWIRYDWNQIEYRLIAHYAIGQGADDIRSRYLKDPNTDYHTELGEMTGIAKRTDIKRLNFGTAYGMGYQKMASLYAWNLEEAYAVYQTYHKKVPFIKETSSRVALKAKRKGYIQTILKRKARLPSRDKAYVMFNRLIQGSAADLMKKAMVDAYKQGIFNVLAPHLTVHDELDCSKPNTKAGDEASLALKNVMENCVKLQVPIIVSCEVGPSWGELTPLEF